MTPATARALPLGTLVYCTVFASRGWYKLLAIRPRDGYLKIEGFGPWCPPHNFTLTAPETARLILRGDADR